MHFQLYIKKANSLTAGRQTDRQTDIHIDICNLQERKDGHTDIQAKKKRTEQHIIKS